MIAIVTSPNVLRDIFYLSDLCSEKEYCQSV